ncbi:MAG: hypothetical protein ABW221_17110 [Vicinamibacteria bacterium]
MPIKSKAQRRKFAELLVEGKITPETFEEWNRGAGGKELPERLHPERQPVKKAAKKKTAKKKAARKTGAKKAVRKTVKKTSRKTAARRGTAR